MDTSIRLRLELTLKLIEVMREYERYLNQFINRFDDELENARHNGLLEAVYENYRCRYQSANEGDITDILSIINNDCVPYLEDVAKYLQETLGHSVTVGLFDDKVPFDSGDTKVRQFKDGIKTAKQLIFDRNNRELEETLGIKKEKPYSTEKADTQNANPQYGTKSIYGVNCATCAAAYVLRKRGFDVKAKGNPVNKEGNPLPGQEGSYNYLLSVGKIDIWKNLDGTVAKPTTVTEWLDKNGKKIDAMTKDDYMAYFEETCREKGIYILNLEWERVPYGHATILQREDDGRLYYIEPQLYDEKTGPRRSLDDLFKPKQHLASHPSRHTGILRVDDKLFDTQYASLFYTN